MMSVLEAIRPDLRGFAGYESAGAADTRAAVRLDANESPWAPLVSLSAAQLNRYPEPRPRQLCEVMAGYYELEPDNVLVTPGSDAAIDLLIRATCRAGRDAVLSLPPTFGMYAVGAKLQDARLIEVPLLTAQNFEIDQDRVLTMARDPAVRIVFVCSPNNPTGGEASIDWVRALCRETAGRALVVVDEAYQEFSDQPSLCTQIQSQPNLVVLRTLSKAHALAGIRCGALLATPALRKIFSALLSPYPLPSTTIAAATGAFSDEALAATRQRVARLKSSRESLKQRLEACVCVQRVLPSAGNFLLFSVTDIESVRRGLIQAGVQVRAFANEPMLKGWLRAAVGTDAENDALIAALESLS